MFSDFEVLQAAKWYFQSQLEECDEAQEYLGSRGVSLEDARDWGLGWAPPGRGLYQALGSEDPERLIVLDLFRRQDLKFLNKYENRLMFPIHDFVGNCLGFSGRVLDDSTPKYIHNTETPVFRKSEVFYGIEHAREAVLSSREMIVCEGYMDVIAMHLNGFTNAVAVMGTVLTENHVRSLLRWCESLVLMFDGDGPGQRAAKRSLRTIKDCGVNKRGQDLDVRVVSLPDSLDPAEFFEEYEVSAMKELLEDDGVGEDLV